MPSESGLLLVCPDSIPEVGMLFTFGLYGGRLNFMLVVRTLCEQSVLQYGVVNVHDI